MTDRLDKIKEFLSYVQSLEGDEKGESQVFCDRLFKAFGHDGYKEAGATLEYRVKATEKSTKFADLVWRPRMLLEMKKRGTKLEKDYDQVFEYWLELVPARPKYVVLCNFDEFWIYDFNIQLREPLDKVDIKDLPHRLDALSFLFTENKNPVFQNNLVDVTRNAADKVAQVFNQLISRGVARESAQRFILQCVIALFAEDVELIENTFFTRLLERCNQGESSYDLVTGLFRQMGNPQRAPQGSLFENIPYFNGGIFSVIDNIALEIIEINFLLSASKERWSKVNPAIFGTLFESSIDKPERHALGAHFTDEVDIQKIILPTIIRPWMELIDSADHLRDLLALREKLINFKVLDPACGSGNFLYVAYRELKRIEAKLLTKIHTNFSGRATANIGTMSLLKTSQFFGIDINPFAVELAKITMMLAKKLALDEEVILLGDVQLTIPLKLEEALPLDNLDNNIYLNDALLCDWPKVDVIIGNPPFQSKNKMKAEYGNSYVEKIRAKYPEVPGRADYCVYWFRRTHDELDLNKRAGLVGTNTISQNYSRQGGLDYIVNNGGTITEAVSTQVWPGDAVVHVSIVNWIKGTNSTTKKLFTQLGSRKDSDWKIDEVAVINSALSAKIDVTGAKKLNINAQSGACYQGQTHGHKGFLLTVNQAAEFITQDEKNKEVILPYLTGENLLAKKPPLPQRYIIDLNHCNDIFSAMSCGSAFLYIQNNVMGDMKAKADEEREDTDKETGPRQSHFKHWWKFWRNRTELIQKISNLSRYIVCSRVTQKPIFEFIDSKIRPNDALQVFTLADDYSFGILQSKIHWEWVLENYSTMKGDARYTSDTVFDTFAFPQSPTLKQAKEVAKAGVELRQLRRELMSAHNMSFRALYRTLDTPGQNSLRTAQEKLDKAVMAAYGIKAKEDILSFLLDLNFKVQERENNSLVVVAPGLPPCVKEIDVNNFITDDCVRMPE
jgi:type II restriction/modification system DNA methylase subunit YeeA